MPLEARRLLGHEEPAQGTGKGGRRGVDEDDVAKRFGSLGWGDGCRIFGKHELEDEHSACRDDRGKEAATPVEKTVGTALLVGSTPLSGGSDERAPEQQNGR